MSIIWMMEGADLIANLFNELAYIRPYRRSVNVRNWVLLRYEMEYIKLYICVYADMDGYYRPIRFYGNEMEYSHNLNMEG